jgi:hypothetical protein
VAVYRSLVHVEQSIEVLLDGFPPRITRTNSQRCLPRNQRKQWNITIDIMATPMDRMTSQPRGQPGEPRSAAALEAWLPTVLRAAAVTAVVALAGIGYFELTAHGGLPGVLPAARTHSEELSEADRQQRLQAFVAQGPLALRRVERPNVELALDSMTLTPQARSALDQDLDPAAAQPAVSAERQALTLAWITLWDTDVEDGDVVRIDAQGYSRTVVLTKKGVTFAIPVPAGGIVTLTGIKDGDGGGITVGLASAGVAAVFPIMSTGQTLGLSVIVK